MIGLHTISTGALALFLILLCTPLILLRFSDWDMAICYHWSHGVGHTYAFGSADIMEAPLVPAEIEEEETDLSRQEVGHPEKDENSLDERPGEDDMVYQNDSNDNVSKGDADDGACS